VVEIRGILGNMKPGDLIRNRRVVRSEFALSFSVFSRYLEKEDWMGTVLSVEEPNENIRYTVVHVLLSDGSVEKTWLRGDEIRDYVEVISETG
jgi:hypothetical protein